MRILYLLVLLAVTVMPAAAQSEANEAYAEALRRIEAARVTGVTALDLGGLGLMEVPTWAQWSGQDESRSYAQTDQIARIHPDAQTDRLHLFNPTKNP